MNPFKGLFLSSLFFYVCGGLILVMVLSYVFPSLLAVALTGCALFGLVCLIDYIQLYHPAVKLTVNREVAPVLSLGDDNPIRLTISNGSGTRLNIDLVDELPEQLQNRNFKVQLSLEGQQSDIFSYTVKPLSRGEFFFGNIHLFVSTSLNLVVRKLTQSSENKVPVYPSIIQMRKYELKTIARIANEFGVKKVRRIGHSYEFEHIKQYVRGDDYRSINWKATGRRSHLMVNQYEDEKSQQVYCIIDKSRVMHMPFAGLSLFDYAVNASLVISNIVLGKQDKIGLITFAEKAKTLIKADRNRLQLRKILEGLYREKEGAVEANYESLYLTTRKFITGRSLLFFYTNFESTYALQRALPQLRKLNTQHLLVVVFFENTEITVNVSAHVETVEDIYRQVTGEHFVLTKIQLAQQLRQLGIITILTRPENLTLTTINKYLELKSRGMI
jgi:uncharacterized protein (DUF58 family)